MAIQTVVMMTADNGKVVASYAYDDQSLVIQTVDLNNQSGAGTVTMALRNRNTNAIVWGPFSQTENMGLTSRDVSNLNQRMVHLTGTNKFGPYDVLVPPFNPDISWHGNATFAGAKPVG